MSQNSFQEKRQLFTKQRRRQQVQEIISSRRKAHSIEWAQNQKQTFLNLLPIINQQNYQENRIVLTNYARSTMYSYQMLPIVFFSYQYLLSHPFDAPSWEIVTFLSYYEDFQIPQTEQFVQILLKYLDENPLLISELLLNTSKLPKCNLLCCRLADASIIYILGEKIQSIENLYVRSCLENNSAEFQGKDDLQLQIHNFLLTLTQLFSIQPIIEIYQMKKICEILNFQTKSNKFLKQIQTQATFKLIENAIQSLSHQSSVIELLVEKFEQKITNSFFLYEEESIRFLDCCVNSKVILNKRLIKNLFVTIKSKSTKNKVSALKILQKILDSTNKCDKMEVEPNKFQTLQPFIENKICISFEDFNSMFTSSKTEPQNPVSQAELFNYCIVYSLLFTQNYESELKVLFEIFESSCQKIQEQIAIFIKAIVESLIREIDFYEPKKLLNYQKEKLTPENMRRFLDETVSHEETYYFLSQCLKSLNVSLISIGLDIIKDLLFYFRDIGEEIQEENFKVDLSFIVNQIQKSNIYLILEHLMVSQSQNIRDLTEDVLSIITEAKI